MGLELDDALLGEDVRNDLALAGMIVTVARVEDTAVDRDEGVVEIGFQSTIAVRVDNGEGVRVGNGNMIGGDTYEWAVFLMHLMHYL